MNYSGSPRDLSRGAYKKYPKPVGDMVWLRGSRSPTPPVRLPHPKNGSNVMLVTNHAICGSRINISADQDRTINPLRDRLYVLVHQVPQIYSLSFRPHFAHPCGRTDFQQAFCRRSNLHKLAARLPLVVKPQRHRLTSAQGFILKGRRRRAIIDRPQYSRKNTICPTTFVPLV